MHAEIVAAARRARAEAIRRWMTLLNQPVRIWIDSRALELEERARTSASTTASWLWWRT